MTIKRVSDFLSKPTVLPIPSTCNIEPSKMHLPLFFHSYYTSMLFGYFEDKVQLPQDGIQRAPISSSGHLSSLKSCDLAMLISLTVPCLSLFGTSTGSCQHCSIYSVAHSTTFDGKLFPSLFPLWSLYVCLFWSRFHLYFNFKITWSYCIIATKFQDRVWRFFMKHYSRFP